MSELTENVLLLQRLHQLLLILVRDQVAAGAVASCFQIVKENCSVELSGPTPQDDVMERLLRAREGRRF